MKKDRKKTAFILVMILIVLSALALALINLQREQQIRVEREKIEAFSAADALQKSGLFYYNRLTAEEQQIYTKVLSAAAELQEETESFPVTLSVSGLDSIYAALTYDNPQMFYVTGLLCKTEGGYSVIRLQYADTKDTIRKMVARLSAAVGNAKDYAAARGANTPFETAAAMHDYLALTASHADTGLKTNAYSALVLGEAGPDGYAKAYKLLLSEAGILSYTVSGKTEAGEETFWNVVFLEGDDKFYHADTFRDDGEKITHAYFLLDDARFLKDRTAALPGLPVCSDPGDYYKRTGAFSASGADLDTTLFSLIARASAEATDTFEFSAAGSDETAVRAALSARIKADFPARYEDFTLETADPSLSVYRVVLIPRRAPETTLPETAADTAAP